MKKVIVKTAIRGGKEVTMTGAVKLANAKAKTEAAVALHKDRVAAKAPVIIEAVPPMSTKSLELPPTRPIHEALVMAGFSMSAVAQANGTHAYSHPDGRTALYAEPDKWAVLVNGERHEGTDKAMKDLAMALMVVPAAKPVDALAHVVRAIEILKGMTDGTFALDLLKGDKNYKHRVTLLKKLFQTDKVLVKDSALPALVMAFHTALGITNGRSADAKAVDFAVKCKAALAAKTKAVKMAAKDLDKNRKVYLAATEKERAIKDGKVMLPPYKKQGKAARAAEAAALSKELQERTEHPELPAVPRPDAELTIVAGDVRLLEDPANGLVLLQVEKANSQGAICVYNNGRRVAAGVVAPDTLKTLRTVNGADLVKAANQLLSPIAPSVPVTPTAARHLTAVLHCKELTPMANTKKFAPPANAAKKNAKEVKPAKAAKTTTKKESTGRTALYRLLNDAKAKWSAFKGQKAVVVDALVKAGAVGKTGQGITSSALYAKLDGKLETNSTVERIAGFYLSTWQKEGILEKYEPAA